MTPTNLLKAIVKANEFIERARIVRVKVGDDPFSIRGCKETAACRRASMELMALVKTEMVRVEEVFLAYAQMKDGKTLFETMAEKGFKALPSPEE